MDRRDDARRILRELRELEDAGKQDASRDRAILRALGIVNKNLIAIGQIVFARFDNADEQLDRIEAGAEPPQPRVQVITTITAVRNRQ